MIDSASVAATEAAPVARRKKARRKLTFDRVSFIVVFLGLPLAIFLVFVIWPFVQAFYYSHDRLVGLLARHELHRSARTTGRCSTTTSS